MTVMRRLTQRISPAGFAKFKDALMRAELEGYGADAAAAMTLKRFGFPAIPWTETVFVVDWSADQDSHGQFIAESK